MRIKAFMLAGLATLAASVSAAQTLPPGSRVRLVPADKYEPQRKGEVVTDAQDSAMVRFEPDPIHNLKRSTEQVPHSRLEVVVATRRYTKTGAGMGALAGIVAGAIVARPYRPYCEPVGRLGEPNCYKDETPTVVLGLAGGLVGAGAGALVGRLIRRDTWKPVGLTLHLALH
jgi:hypothetical protein